MTRRRPPTWRTTLVAAAVAGTAILALPSAQAGAPAAAPAASFAPQDARPVVRTTDGLLAGSTGAQVTRFLGVPYAQAPVGDLRWKAPRPAARWDGVRDATRFGGSCTQGSGWDPGYEQDTLNEDCLYLNVYVPSSATTADDLPVVVWNHGGGNTGGAGRDTDPARFLASQDAVFVTINYRLGAMGWLDTTGLEAANGDDGSAGNFGLLDQQAALRWVQENISAFGGDPRDVTLAGQSAGASNTCAQMASPAAQNLFARAVLQSGGCTGRAPEVARAAGEAFAVAAGCPDPATQLDCLRAKSPEEVLRAQQASSPGGGAVVGNRVVPESPAVLLAQGRLTDKPVVVGGTSDESQQSVFGNYDHKGNPLTEQTYADLVRATYPAAAEEVLATYPAAEAWSPSVAWGTVSSDVRACQVQTLRSRFAADTATWAYEFAEEEGPAFTSIWRLGVDYPFGATHVNDLGYLWDYLGTSLPFDSDQTELSQTMTTFWGTFARTGDPNGPTTPTWPRYDRSPQVMRLVAPGSAAVPSAQVSADHHCGLWDRVAPLA